MVIFNPKDVQFHELADAVKDLLAKQCDVSHNTDSNLTLEHAKKWITSCHGHDICQNKAIDGPFCPTRVLDVNANDSREIRLIETGECTGLDSVPYIALSHCWGGSIKTQLTEKNLEEMKHSISADKLPKNFQDAISITRRLGAQYLWIDSLCTIQDSHEDWVRESAKMGLLYANAICTISATASRNSSGGCFLSRDPFIIDCILRSKQRACTFQERVLSRRVLHFCDGLVLIECNTLQASEYHVNGVLYPRKVNVRYNGKLNVGITDGWKPGGWLPAS